MAFRASNIVPSKGYDNAKSIAVRLKTRVDDSISTAAAQSIGYDFIAAIRFDLARANTELTTISTIPGIAAYAQAQEDDDTYVVATEFTAMLSAISGAVSWIDTNVPTSVTALTPDQWDGANTLIATTFTPAQTAGFRTELQAVSDAIV